MRTAIRIAAAPMAIRIEAVRTAIQVSTGTRRMDRAARIRIAEKLRIRTRAARTTAVRVAGTTAAVRVADRTPAVARAADRIPAVARAVVRTTAAAEDLEAGANHRGPVDFVGSQRSERVVDALQRIN